MICNCCHRVAVKIIVFTLWFVPDRNLSKFSELYEGAGSSETCVVLYIQIALRYLLQEGNDNAT